MHVYKGQLISKANCQAVNSSKKWTNQFVCTAMQHVFVHFLEEIEVTKKTFRNYLTFTIMYLFLQKNPMYLCYQATISCMNIKNMYKSFLFFCISLRKKMELLTRCHFLRNIKNAPGLKVHSRILFCKWLGHDMISIETFLRNYLIMYELQGDKELTYVLTRV